MEGVGLWWEGFQEKVPFEFRVKKSRSDSDSDSDDDGRDELRQLG